MEHITQMLAQITWLKWAIFAVGEVVIFFVFCRVFKDVMIAQGIWEAKPGMRRRCDYCGTAKRRLFSRFCDDSCKQMDWNDRLAGSEGRTYGPGPFID